MSNDDLEQDSFLKKKTVSPDKQRKAGRIIAVILLFLLVVPTLNMIPNREVGGFNRPLFELANFIVVAIWIWIRISYGKYVRMRPKWFEAALLLLPITFVISDLVYAFSGGSLNQKHVYAILDSLRPIAFVQLSMFILRWGKVKLTRFGDVMRVLVNVISWGVIYIGILAVLQTMGISIVQNFIHFFYRFEAEWLADIAYDAIQNYGRATSIFHWATSLGAFLAVALLILFVNVLDHPNRKSLRLPIIAICLGLFGIVLSGSRMAFIVLAIGLFVILILRWRFKVFLGMLVGGMVIFLAMGFVEQKTGRASRFTELFSFISGNGVIPKTLDYRLGNTSSIVSAFVSSNISHWAGTTVTDYKSLVPRSFDNEFLKYLVWSGYLGLVAFALFQAGVIYRSWLAFRYFPRDTPGNTLSLSLLAASIGMVVSAYSQDTWGGERTLQLVFIVLGVLVYFRNLQANKSMESQTE